MCRRAWYALLVLCGISSPSTADEPPKMRIFGHLTQAYGWSDEGSIRGTAEGGTSDLRNLALQFRWEKSEKETVVVQLSHERRGNDFLFPEEDEVEVDWAFYERRLGPHSELKVGRLNVPLGIYNEIRDVGTLLPFFDLPVSFYAGVLSSAETVDGFSIARTLAPRTEWDLDAIFYFGGWKTQEQRVNLESRFLLENREATAENGLGLQLWLSTPVPSLRLGGGYLTWELEGPLAGPEVRDRWRSAHLSLDASSERWMVRSELRRWRFDQDLGAFVGTGSRRGKGERDGFYLQAGVWITPSIGLFMQYEELELRDSLGVLPPPDDFHEDLALSLNYRFRSDLLLKAEVHSSDTFIPLGKEGAPPGGAQVAAEVTWAIVGLSVDF